MPISTVATSNTFNEFRITTNLVIDEVNKLSDGTANLVIDTITANTFTGVVTDLDIVGDTGNDVITLGTDTLTFVGGNGISSTVTANTVTHNLETSGVSSGTYGSASQVPIIVVDQYGRITSASNTNVAGVSNFQYFSANSNFVINTADGGSFAAGIGQDLGTSANVSFQDLTVTGNVVFTGNVVSVTANNLVVEDNIISLAKNNTTDAVDIGFLGHYNDGANVHTGLFRDATDSTWKFFQNYPIEPTTNANIDTSNADFEFASVKAHNIEANGIFTGIGSGLTTLNASNVSSGTLSSGRLPTSGVTAGTYGSASSVPQIVVDSYGRATSVANVAISISSGAVSGLATSATTDTSNASNISSGTLNAARLPTSGVSANTYGSASSVPQIVVDTYGRATSVANVNIAISSSAVSGLATSATTDTSNASNISTGTLPGDRGVTAGSASSSFVEYNGTTATSGQFDGGTTNPSGTTRLNYGGYLYATRFYGDGSNLTNISAPSYTISNQTGAYTVVSGDLGKIINCTANTFTVSLTAAATLGAGFNVTIWNTSTTASHVITIDPNGAETIDGRTTLLLRCGEGTEIVCDGTNWQTGDKKTMRGYAENFTQGFTRPVASGDGSICVGPQTTASGGGSIAIGAFAQSTSEGSIAIGGNTVQTSGARATGIAAIAIGARASGGTLASGNHAIAIGAASSGDPTASAANSTAIGSNSGSTGSQAVTGAGAMALGGSYASGTDSFAAAIADNTSSYGARGANSVAMGYRAQVQGQYGVAIGANSNASGNFSHAFGYNATSALYGYAIGHSAAANGTGSLALGYYSVASANYSTAIGYESYVPTTIGKYNYANGSFANSASVGDTQYGLVVLRCATTGAVATVLTSNGSAASTNNQLILPNNSAFAFSALIVARQQASGGTQSAAWKIEGLIRREGSAATTTLVNSAITVLNNTSAWSIAVSADTTNGGLAITATGSLVTNIRWVATVQTSEVIYA